KLAPEALCEVLFQTPTDSRVTVAAFSDFYCPYCKVLTARLAARDDIAVTWHELPLLGPASDVAARAAVAAARQGGYVALQTRLTATQFRPTRRFLADMADALGLSAKQLLVDMDSEDVAQTLARSRRASRTLGIWGTPAVAVGSTLVIGAIDDAALSALIAEEAARGGC
ncbi:MAG: DsbA family protein, partial [Pseudomonadota bacterium]